VYTLFRDRASLAVVARVGIREFRANLAVFLRRAQAGERVVLTVDGSPVAAVGPVAADPLALTLADLAARGALVPPRRRGDFVLPEPIALWSGTRIDRAVSQIRS